MTMPMLVVGIIGLIIYFICEAQKEKQERIDKHGYCYMSEKLEDLPEERQRFIYRKKNEEKIKKSEGYVQAARKVQEELLLEFIDANPGVRVNVTVDKSKNNTLPSLDSFQIMANKLPSHLGIELMNAAKKESRACAIKGVASLSGLESFLHGVDDETPSYELGGIVNSRKTAKNHVEAWAQLDNVMIKVNEYLKNNQ
jgi:hypothetical protein